MASKYFSPKAIQGLNRIGDILIPQSDEFPSFSTYGAAERVDDIVAYAQRGDVATLNTVLGVMAWLPNRFLLWIAANMAEAHTSNSFIAPLFRQLNTGLRGIIFTAYYAGKSGKDYQGPDPLDIIGYKLNRVDN